jgi:hypothetical protein
MDCTPVVVVTGWPLWYQVIRCMALEEVAMMELPTQ